MCSNSITMVESRGRNPSALTKFFLYLMIAVIPIMIFPISVDKNHINIRAIREVCFFSFAIVMASTLQDNKWLRYFLIWCVVSWWLNFFIPQALYMGLVNVLSAVVVYIGLKYLLKSGIIKTEVVLKLICVSFLFQLAWMVMQKFRFDPVFYGVNAIGKPVEPNSFPLVGWSGNPSLLAIFFAFTSFLFLSHFRIKNTNVLFFLIIIPLFLLKNATANIAFTAGLIFYLFNRASYTNKVRLFWVCVLSLIYLIFVKHPNFDRIIIWKQLLKHVFVSRPFVGKGINYFANLLITDKTGTVWAEAHNDYLQILFETGIVGFVLFMAFIVSKFKEFFKNYRTPFQLSLMSCLVAYLVSALSLFPMHLAEHSFYTICILTCLENSYGIAI